LASQAEVVVPFIMFIDAFISMTRLQEDQSSNLLVIRTTDALRAVSTMAFPLVSYLLIETAASHPPKARDLLTTSSIVTNATTSMTAVQSLTVLLPE
jgi:hypothetical protein